MTRTTLVIIGFGFLFVLYIILANGNNTNSTLPSQAVSAVTEESGSQVVTINVKGGYSPKESVARAGVPTIIRFKTNGTFDCSSAVRLPSLGISRTLPQTGQTDIAIGTSTEGIFTGVCGMGMYSFTINFRPS
jgi:plastocyanin domain-containing protein